MKHDNARVCGGNSTELHIHQTNQGTASTVRCGIELLWSFSHVLHVTRAMFFLMTLLIGEDHL